MRTLSLAEARRLAVKGALLSAPRPTDMVDTIRWLGGIQLDPVAVVARAEQMVLFSRLGPYDVGELKRHLEEEGDLFEWGAFIFDTDQLPYYRSAMESYPPGGSGRAGYVRSWLEDNQAFRSYILEELAARGPLRSRDLDDRAEVPWQTGGWNDGKNLGRMLEILWMRGEIAISARQGTERVWDLEGRVLPPLPAAPEEDAARWAVETQLRWRGIARPKAIGFTSLGRLVHGRDELIEDWIDQGRALRVEVDGLSDEWIADAELLDAPFAPRTVLLSPFDRLVSDRVRLAHLFDFDYHLEMYVPIARRQYGYYVLPILRGERFVGRMDARVDREARVLNVTGLWREPDAPDDAWPDVRAAIDELAAWLGVEPATPEGAWSAPLREDAP